MKVGDHELDETEVLLLGGAALLLFIMVKGLNGAANAAAQALVNAAGGAITGTVDATGQAIGLPALADITTDANVARWIIDAPNGGTYQASIWSSAAALFNGELLPSGSGYNAPAGSKIATLFPTSATVIDIGSGSDTWDTGSIDGSW